MPSSVCCPSCWTWSDVGSRSTCKRCGSPLVLADGRRLDAVLQEPAPPPPPAGVIGSFGAAGYGQASLAGTMALPTRETLLGTTSGRDWVGVARWFAIADGVLTMIVLIAVGLLARHIALPISNPTTGTVTTEFIDVGPIFAIAAIVVAAVTALAAWLTRFTTARVVFLLLDALAIVAAVSQLAAAAVAGGVGIAAAVSLAIDGAYAWVIVMSLLPASRQRV